MQLDGPGIQGDSSSSLINQGTLTKTSATQATLSLPLFTNGTLSVAGNLHIVSDFVCNGAFAITASAVVSKNVIGSLEFMRFFLT